MIPSDSAPVLDNNRERERDLRDAVDSALEKSSMRAFEPTLEVEFEDATRSARRRRLQSFFSICVPLVIGCLLLDRVAGELRLGIVVRLFVDVPLLLLAVWLLRQPISLGMECLSIALPSFAVVAATVVLGEAAPDLYRSRILMSAAMFVPAVNVILPIRFRHARVITICSILLFDGLVLSGAGFAGPGHDGDLAGFATVMALISLNVVYRAEAARRGAFLLTLRDRFSSLDLSRANERLVTLSQTDGLTNVFNRRFFDTTAPQVRARSLQNQTRLALMMIDVDHFKALNDTIGHAEGDVCLQRIARAIGAHARAGDIVARYGGEEFVVVLPETDATAAALVAERIRAAVESLHFDNPHGPRVMTVSIGVASLAADERGSILDLVNAADTALYAAKSAGRNCVVCARSPVAA